MLELLLTGIALAAEALRWLVLTLLELLGDYPGPCLGAAGVVVFLAFIRRLAAGSTHVRCASCGWLGTLGRWKAAGGCPACRSDVYRS